MERDGERDDFQGNGKSLREGNTREKQSKEMHLPDRAAAVGQRLHKLCHIALRSADLQVRRVKKERRFCQGGTVLLFLHTVVLLYYNVLLFWSSRLKTLGNIILLWQLNLENHLAGLKLTLRLTPELFCIPFYAITSASHASV